MTEDVADSWVQSKHVLEVAGLSYHFGDRTVLSDVSFTVDSGGVLGLLGPNGSGKSTVLSLISGILRLQTGKISYDGRPVSPNDRRFRTDTAVVFQSPSLDKKLTAIQNLELTASMYGLAGRGVSDRIHFLLDAAGLAERGYDRVDTYSGGMARRLDIARALLPRPRLLLMDEPTTGLDEVAFRATWDRLDAMRHGEHLAVVVATHRTEEAERCDRLVFLRSGKVIVTDSPAALKSRIARDVILLATDEPKRLSEQIHAVFALPTLVRHDSVVVECDAGHMWIPRLVETFPSGSFQSVSLRRPSLSDVFLKLTGTSLGDDSFTFVSGDQSHA